MADKKIAPKAQAADKAAAVPSLDTQLRRLFQQDDVGTDADRAMLQSLCGIDGYHRNELLSDGPYRLHAIESLSAIIRMAISGALAGWGWAKIEGFDEAGIVPLVDPIIRSKAMAAKMTNFLKRTKLQGVTFVAHRVVRGHPTFKRGLGILASARAIVCAPPGFGWEAVEQEIRTTREFHNGIGIPSARLSRVEMGSVDEAIGWLINSANAPVCLTRDESGLGRLKTATTAYKPVELMRLVECLSQHRFTDAISGVGTHGRSIASKLRSKQAAWHRGRHETGSNLDDVDVWAYWARYRRDRGPKSFLPFRFDWVAKSCRRGPMTARQATRHLAKLRARNKLLRPRPRARAKPQAE